MGFKMTSFAILVTIIFLSTLWVSDLPAKEIVNMLKNPDFDDRANPTAGWSIGAGGTLVMDKKEKSPTGHPVVNAVIDAVGANDWEPEIHSPSFDVELSKQYTVDFYAKTEPKATRTLGVKFEQLETWTGPSTTITLNDQWQQFVFSPIMTMKSPPAVVIHIQFNKLKEDVWFSHFRVYEGKFVEEQLGTPKIAVNPMGSLSTAWGKIKGF